MSRDEIGGRGDREPLMPRRARVALGAGVLVVAALVALSRLGGAGGPGPPPTPSPTASSPAPASDWVRVTSVCPVETDHLRRLTVRFVLTNLSLQPVTIESVRPVLLAGGLRLHSTWVGGGDCHRLAPQVAAGPVPAGGHRLALMSFRIPPECPGPLSVAARAWLRRDGVARSAELPTLVVLSGATFASCLDR